MPLSTRTRANRLDEETHSLERNRPAGVPGTETVTRRAMRLTGLPSPEATRPLGQRNTRAVILRHGLRAAAVVALVLVVAVVALIVVVIAGPTEFGMVRTRVAAALEKTLGSGYQVAVGRTVVDLDPVLGLVLQVNDIEVTDTQKAVVAQVPATRLALDPLALFGLRVEVRSIELSKANIAFVRASNGEVYLGNAATAHAVTKQLPPPVTAQAAPPPATLTPGVLPADPDGGFPDLLQALQILDRGIEPPINSAVRSGFERFSLVDSNIDVWDAQLRQQRRFPSTDLIVSVDSVTSGISANFSTSGYGGRWSATIERNVNQGSRGRTMSAVFSQLTVADILPGLADKGRGITADIPLYGRASIDYAPDGAVENASIRLDLGAGNIRFGQSRESILLDEATVKLRWDLPNKVLVVEPSTFFFGNTRGVLTGTIRPKGDQKERRYSFDLSSQGAILAPRDSPEPPMIVQRIALSGEADFPGKLLRFDNIELVSPEASIAAAGSLGFEGSTPSLAAAATFSEMPAGAFKQIWPAFLGPGARKWFIDHVTGGHLVSGRFEAAVPSGVLWTGKRLPIPEDQLRLDLRFENASFTTIGNLPPIINATGNAVLAGTTFGVDLESGSIQVPSGSTVDVNAGAFAVANTVSRTPVGRIELQLSGDAEPLGEIANAAPFSALDRRQIKPSDLSGTGTASVSVQVPLKPGITPADVDWRVSVNAKNLTSKAPIDGRLFSDANVNITVTQDDVNVKGKARIDGVMAQVNMSQPITSTGSAAGAGQRSVRLLLDDKARKQFGIGLDDVLGGTVEALVSNISDGSDGQHYDLDLKSARVVLPGFGWSKGIGVPATLSFDMKPATGGRLIDNLVLKGSGFGFSGTAKLDDSYGLAEANITQFSLRKGDSLTLKLTRNKAGYAVVARGSSFDLRGFLGHLKDATDGGGNAADISIDAKVDRLTGYNQAVISDGSLSVITSGGTVTKLAFAGNIEGTPVNIAYSDTDAEATLLATCADAGAVLRFMDVYSRFSGGSIRLVGRRNGPSGPLAGTFEIADFTVVNEPAMQKVVATQTQGPNPAPTGFDANRVQFNRLVANFSKTGDVIAIRDALLRGPAVGATFGGRLDLSNSQVSITGTYLPAYALNNFFGRIPILGLAFGGGSQGGLIGVTFKIDGRVSEPRFFINPLSAVAPGIFRKIFEFQ
jgi:hypothetical protein